MLSTLRNGFGRQFSSVRHFSKSYHRALEKYPIFMQAFQAGLLMGTGDFLAQTVIEKTNVTQVDYTRTMKFFSIGFCVAGPGLRKWYGLLDKHFTAQSPMKRTFQKVFVDQFIFAPVFLGILLSFIGYSQHQDIDKVKEKLQFEYLDILKSNYAVWPMVQIINFRFVPLNYQVLLTQSVAVLWNVYVSWRTNLYERKINALNANGNTSNSLQLQTNEQPN